jgi:hypothetical protein
MWKTLVKSFRIVFIEIVNRSKFSKGGSFTPKKKGVE